MALPKRWVIAPPAPPEHLARYRGMSPLLAQVLINRGFTNPKDANAFLYDKTTTHNPFDLIDMNKAVGRIRQAIKRREPMVVYGDFDADGVTSTTLLVQALRSMHANVRPYIPHRIDEGYGLNSEALLKLAKEGIRLVVTVDCGIRSVQEVEDAKRVGLDIVITDHHSLGPDLPDAYAVVNPKRGKYQEEMLAGVGVAFKLVQALIMAERKQGPAQNGKSGDPMDVSQLLDLVAIGTVADLMPLNRLENRVFVRRGLEMLNKAQRPGVRALLEVSGVQPGSVDTTAIGFALGPRINAAGRLDDAILAYNLLAAPNMTEAQKWAEKLQELNTKRQNITRAAQEAIQEQLELEEQEDIPLIFASHASFEPGIVGLVAGRLTEKFFRPAVVMEQGESESRASCRSIPQFDITSALDQCADLLVRHGGHALAAGFTILNENIPDLRKKLLQLAETSLHGQSLSPTLDVDVEVDVHTLSEEMLEQLTLLEPCGHENDKPVFMARNVHVAECRTVGKDSKHLKLKISRAGRPALDAIGFNLGDWAQSMPERIDIAFQLEINEWQGRQSLQANLQDVRPVESLS
ncbi:MAG: single-stranded-DNA-specific exonuclease RecJ [Anaerolineae bacterium]